MAREKLFTEEGHIKLEGTNALQVGVPTKVTFTSKVKGEGNKFVSGDNEGKGTMTLNNGRVKADYEGKLGGFPWKSDENSNVVGRKIQGTETVTVEGFPEQIEMDTEMDLDPPWKFTNTGYRK
jgi:hypothetical protein